MVNQHGEGLLALLPLIASVVGDGAKRLRYLRECLLILQKARNLIDAMSLSTEEIGWDSQQHSIVNGRVY